MALNEKYSLKSLKRRSFKDQPVGDFNNSTIKGSCFYWECPEADEPRLRDIFPDGMEGVIFERCNLDNILVDEVKNTVLPDCCNRLIKVQNDLDNWILDKTTKLPVELVVTKRRIDLGISVDPADIPGTKMPNNKNPIDLKREEISIAVDAAEKAAGEAARDAIINPG